jgi:hypothetical protein
MPAACEWPGGCANDPHHQVPDGVPVYRLTKIDSDETDGNYCRVHARLRVSQMGKERRAARRTGQEGRGDE